MKPISVTATIQHSDEASSKKDLYVGIDLTGANQERKTEERTVHGLLPALEYVVAVLRRYGAEELVEVYVTAEL